MIGPEASGLEPEEVAGVIREYTIMNDLDALDQEGRTAQKTFDGSALLGPWIETELDPTGLDMHRDIGGERRQETNTGLMLFDPMTAVSFVSQRVTLWPGDVIAFGSPGNPGLVDPGDEVAIEYEGIGTLHSTVVASD